MTLPVDLVIANALHQAADTIERMPGFLRTAAQTDTERLHDALARDLLRKIAETARLDVVLVALAAAGGPATLAEVAQRWQATLDSRKADPAPRPAPFTVVAGAKDTPGTGGA